jgi:16S rRNA (adenine1518-N6/adenine1519-N6)-dimethyltransferase
MARGYNRPKKSLGQNFLIDGGIIARIISGAGIEGARRAETVIEVGPGRGAMTAGLVNASERYVAVEKDDDLASRLSAQYAGRDDVVILNRDVLSLMPPDIPFPAPFRIVANLPYNVGARIAMHFLESWGDAVSEMTMMFQREVANRLVAPAGTGSYSALSVLVQAFCETWMLFGVPPTAFRPVPKVQSAIVRLRIRPRPLFDGIPYPRFNQLVHGAFASRRKTILNGLVLAPGLPHDVSFWRTLLEAAGVDSSLRPDAVPVSGFVEITRRLVASG